MTDQRYARHAILTAAELCKLSYQCHTKSGAKKLNKLSTSSLSQRMPHAFSCDAFYCQAGETPGTVRYVTCFHRETGTLFVCFRGTKSWNEVKLDTRIYMVTVEASSVRVHAGFLQLFQNSFPTRYVSDSLPLKQLGIKSSELQHVVFTGHSLGGAVAILAGYNWMREQYLHRRNHRSDHPLKHLQIHVVTFGAPAVGNQAFFRALKSLKIPITAFVHHADLIAQALTIFEDPLHWLRTAVINPRVDDLYTFQVPLQSKPSDFYDLSRRPESQTRDWMTDAHVPIFNQVDWKKFLSSCDSRYNSDRQKGLKRFVSLTCYPSWPPNTSAWKKNPTRQLYDQYHVNTSPKHTWDLSHNTSLNEQVSKINIKHAHRMQTYYDNLVNEFESRP